MNSRIISTLFSGLLFIAGTVSANPDNENYFGIQYGIGNYSEKDISKDFKPTAAIGRFGHYINPNISIEGRLGIGLHDDRKFLREFGINGLNAEFEIDSILGVYGMGHYNFSKLVSFYGLLGVTQVEATTSVPDFPAADSKEEKTSISYGIGADFNVGKSMILNFEFMRYIEKTNYDLDVIGAGLSFSF